MVTFLTVQNRFDMVISGNHGDSKSILQERSVEPHLTLISTLQITCNFMYQPQMAIESLLVELHRVP